MVKRADTFVDTATTLIEDHTPTGPDAGNAWTVFEQTGVQPFQISTNDELTPASTEAADRLLASLGDDPTEADIVVSVLLVTQGPTDDPAFVYTRAVDVNNLYCAGGYSNASAARPLWVGKKTTASGYEDLVTDTGEAWVSGQIGRLEITGTALEFFIAGVSKLTTTDSSHASAGETGVGVGNIRNSSDDFRGTQDLDNFFWEEVGGGGPGAAIFGKTRPIVRL